MAEEKAAKSREDGVSYGNRRTKDVSTVPGPGEKKDRETITLNMGPQHPSTHGVLRVIIELEGERIVDALPDIGYLHRNFEKICEQSKYPQIVGYTDRCDYVSALTNELPFVRAVEKLADIEVPERAVYLRMILSEIQRISSHLIWFGTFGLDLGAVTPFLYGFREREMTYDLLEKVTGARMLYNYFRIGGLRNDVPQDFEEMTTKFCDVMEDRAYKEYDNLLVKNSIFKARCQGVGYLSKKDAIAWGASGPVLRGSGVDYDLRRHRPYMYYDRLDFNVAVEEAGDVYARIKVRMREMLESVKIIRQGLEQLPDGPVLGDVPRIDRTGIDEGEIYSAIEGPKGEVGCYLISQGDPEPYRLKWRSPCFGNVQVLPLIAEGGLMADMVANIGSLDLIMGEVDR